MSVLLRSVARIPATFFGLIFCFISYVLRLSIPKTSGTLRFTGLKGKVEIVRDSWGVPHIFAQNNHDLFFALGFVHAQDRMWQMEFSRRVASGTLAEVLGEEALPVDRFMRRVGLTRSASLQIGRVSPVIRKALEAYSNGINAHRTHRSRWRLPLEFILLRFRPRPWSIIDSAAISKLFGWVIAPNWDTEIARMWLLDKLGPEKLHEIEPRYPDGDLAAIQKEGAAYRGAVESLQDEYRRVATYLSLGGASNAWVIDGTKSASGKPLLACDPHLPASMPSPWYEVHLNSPQLNVVGVSLPGLPAVITGHNKHIAWGISSGLVDQKDVYLEKLNPEHPEEYLYEGTWQKGEQITESIIVRGKNEPVYEDVLVTRHGPIMNPLLKGEERSFSVRSVEAESLGMFEAGYGIMTAKNWDEFRRALTHWSSPAMNFVYGDTKGNIGYQLAGFIPMRRNHSGLLPVRGWSGEDEWDGFIPFEELPSILNPDTHVLVAANNRPPVHSSSIPIWGEWADPYRFRRISELLENDRPISQEDFRTIQGDVYSSFARELVSLLPKIEFKNKKIQILFDMLHTWDYHIAVKSVEAAIFEVFSYRLYRNFFAPALGELLECYMGKGIHDMAHINALGFRASSNLTRLLRTVPPDWPLGNGVTREDIIRKSFEEAYSYLRSAIGKDKKKWQWGEIHTVTFPHVLGRNKLLRWIFNRGPYPIGGDTNTIPQASYDPVAPFSCSASVVSYRHIIDLGDLSTHWTVNSTGNSGQPRSKYFSDQISLWRSLALHPILFNKGDIQRDTKEVLSLEPLSYKS